MKWINGFFDRLFIIKKVILALGVSMMVSPYMLLKVSKVANLKIDNGELIAYTTAMILIAGGFVTYFAVMLYASEYAVQKKKVQCINAIILAFLALFGWLLLAIKYNVWVHIIGVGLLSVLFYDIILIGEKTFDKYNNFNGAQKNAIIFSLLSFIIGLLTKSLT